MYINVFRNVFLRWLFRSTCMYPYVPRQFVTSRESPVALVHRASIRPLVHLGWLVAFGLVRKGCDRQLSEKKIGSQI